MWLEIDADGIRVNLQIKGYKPSNEDNWYSNWCNCDFLFTSGDWLNYHKENDEVLLSCEVEELAEEGYAVGKVDVDQNMALAQQFRVVSIPTLILFKDGAEVKRFVGLTSKEELKSALEG